MSNDNRRSDSIKRQSHRRTLLCCSTLCLFSFLLFLFLFIQIFHYHRIDYGNRTIALNVIQFRSSLIQCGHSVVKREYLYKLIQQFTELLKTNSDGSITEQLNKHLFRIEMTSWLEYVLKECYQARQFSVLEQKHPLFIRQMISMIRKEVLYIASFFIKDI